MTYIMNRLTGVLGLLERTVRRPAASALNNHPQLISCSRNCSYTKKVEKLMDSMKTDRLIWIDTELTGLDLDVDRILEVACIVTDSDLNIVAEHPPIVIHENKDVLDSMGSWCLNHHKKTNLYQECLDSKISVTEAEKSLLAFVEKHSVKGKAHMAGNTIYMDKLFIMKHMPRLHDHFHYRIIDVSSVKILAQNWLGVTYSKKLVHRALSDINESIEELKFLRRKMFTNGK